jgi:hypothetical protein
MPPAATTSESEAAPGEPLPPPTIDESDPYQVRAAAVGLHPGLSRVLLARLSPTDYHNAAFSPASKKATSPCSRCTSLPVPQSVAAATSSSLAKTAG